MALVIVAAAAIAVPLGLIRLQDPKLRRLALICANVGVVWAAFLAWSYMAVFSAEEVATANNTWRYLSQLGPMLIYAAFVTDATLRNRHSKTSPQAGTQLRLTAALLCLLVPASMLVTWRHWRIDWRFADIAAARSLVGPLVAAGLGNARLAVVHPTEPFYYGVVLDYGHKRPGRSSIALTQ
jgi:hypothetical protein